MRISELARRSGVPVATVKFYLRERLLHDGALTSATQARYDDTHLARLQLIRALLGPGGLTVAKAREVLAAIDDPPESVHELLGVASVAVSGPIPHLDHAYVHELMRRWGWQVDEKDCMTHAALAEALAGLEAAGFSLADGAMDAYQQHMWQIAEEEVAGVPTDSVDAMVRYVVLGTVLVEPLLLVLRRMAQQEASARRFGAAPPPAPPRPSRPSPGADCSDE